MRALVGDNSVIGGHRIAQGRHGEGEPIVLVHGTPSSSLIWRNVLPELVAAGYEVNLFDMLGFGLSERPWDPQVDTSVSAQVPILLELLALWGLERAHIVGHDIGGGVAQRFALFHPEKVISLTLIDTVSFDSWPSRRTRQQMEAGLDELIEKPNRAHRAHFRDWLRTAVHDTARFEGDALEAYVDMISGPVGQGSYFHHQARHYDHRHTSEIAERLGELGRLPVQIVWGENDAWQLAEAWPHRLRAAIPGSELHILPDCGHFAMEDKPKEIAKLLISFFGRNSSG